VALSSEFGYLECLVWPQHTELYEPAVDPEEQEPTGAPVLVVQGELDDITTPFEGRVVADRFPNSELVIIPNAGHTHSLYYYDGEASQEIRRFLERELEGKSDPPAG
jgi:pimeloyl-ACP methyl ester carboxylesterase